MIDRAYWWETFSPPCPITWNNKFMLKKRLVKSPCSVPETLPFCWQQNCKVVGQPLYFSGSGQATTLSQFYSYYPFADTLQ